jgi:hypothetical protein
MLVFNARTGWRIGDYGNLDLMVVTQVPVEIWHDLNKVICEWYADLIKCDQWMVYQWFEKVKGEPIDRWKKKYTGLPALPLERLFLRFHKNGLLPAHP